MSRLSFLTVLTIWTAAVQCALADTPKPQAAGIRTLTSKHLTLHTDLPASPEVDMLPELFDQAFPQWCAYFGLDPAKHADWHLRGYLMQSRERFEAAGLVPRDLRQFATGFAMGDQLWLFDQTSAYYRRHLLLHEGTHAFMHSLLGGVGPPWYAEGMAELLATHRLEEGRLVLNALPRSRDEVSKWGRIEMVQNAYQARKALSLPRVFAYDATAHSQNEAYGWCWAAAAFLDCHPRYRERFRSLPSLIRQADFEAQLRKLFEGDWAQLNEDWQLFVATIDYGYDFERMQVDYASGEPLPAEGTTASVAADRGWQSSGLRLAPGKYRLQASGRYELAGEPRPWPCEPGGVTLRYCQRQPRGKLLAAIRWEGPGSPSYSGLLKPTAIGLENTLAVEHGGTLYFRVNDAPGQLRGNRGAAQVTIRPAGPKPAAN